MLILNSRRVLPRHVLITVLVPQVRVVLRVSPAVSLAEGEAEVVTLDKRRRQVTLVDPQTRQAQESRVGVAAPKMFAFDQVYTQEDSQVRRPARRECS